MDDAIQALIDAIEAFLKTDQDGIDWESRPAAGGWSRKEVMGHLIDSAQINLQRFVRCTYEENFKLVYAQDEWVTAACYQDADVKETLDLWILLNRQIIRVLSNYPEDRLQITCDTGKSTTSYQTVQWLANDYVRHMKHHFGKIG